MWTLRRLCKISRFIGECDAKRMIHMSPVFQYTAQEKKARQVQQKLAKRKQLIAVTVKPTMTVRELADSMGKTPTDVFNALAHINYHVRVRRENFIIDEFDLLVKIVNLMGFRHKMEEHSKLNYQNLMAELEEKEKMLTKRTPPSGLCLVPRPPVVTIMGHVDHGKTTLIDSLRGSHIVDQEFGGITQHIGAFNVRLASSSDSKPRMITFLDTPGHAAFSTMRSRGAQVTDIVVLVVAAEDSIMAQTVESIKHAKASHCPIIVAINKIDKATETQISNVKKDLLAHELIPEEMGGEVQVVPISALKKTNLELLKEEILAKAEILELCGDPKGLVEGFIIESTMNPHRGKLATVLIKRGTLRKGAFLVAGRSWCKVKFLLDENAKNLTEASLSQPVQVMGWKELPSAGLKVIEVESEQEAKDLVELREKKKGLLKQIEDADVILQKRTEDYKKYQAEMVQNKIDGFTKNKFRKRPNSEWRLSDNKSNQSQDNVLRIILKTDVDGSLEAILNVLDTYEDPRVRLDLIHFEVGQVKPSDIEIAETFGAIIYCFNLPGRETEIEESKVEPNKRYSRVKHFNVIYKMFDDLKEELAALAPKVEKEEKIGEAHVKKIFQYDESNKNTITVAGSLCVNGLIDRRLLFKVIRDNKVIADRQRCYSLKHLKNDVNTVKNNVEFGLSIEDQSITLKPGDTIVCYDVKMVKPVVEWNLGF